MVHVVLSPQSQPLLPVLPVQRRRKVDSVREALERTGSGLRWHVPLAAELIRAKLAEAEAHPTGVDGSGCGWLEQHDGRTALDV